MCRIKGGASNTDRQPRQLFLSWNSIHSVGNWNICSTLDCRSISKLYTSIARVQRYQATPNLTPIFSIWSSDDCSNLSAWRQGILGALIQPDRQSSSARGDTDGIWICSRSRERACETLPHGKLKVLPSLFFSLTITSSQCVSSCEHQVSFIRDLHFPSLLCVHSMLVSCHSCAPK